MKRTLSIFLTAILLVLTVAVAVPSASAVSADVAQTAAYAIPNPAFTVESGTHGVLVAWNADSRVDHYRVYHKTADGWSKIADNIKVGYYFDTSVVKGKSYTFTVRGLNSSNSFVTDYNRNGRTVAFTSYPDKYLLGDTDTDGTVTVMDATLIQRKLVELNIGDYKYIDCLGDSDEDGSLGITDATMIQRYTASIPIPYPVGGKLPDIIGTGGAVGAPTNVKVVSGTKGTKNYEKVSKYQLKSNLHSASKCVEVYLDNPEPPEASDVSSEAYIESTFEYLDNGKVRINFTPKTPDKITSLAWWIKNENGDWYNTEIPLSTFKNGSGYYDYQMPELEDERVYPSVDVTWGKSSNAEGYDVVIKDAKGKAVSKVVTAGKNATSATVQLTTFDAGTFTAEVKAKSGKNTAVANGTFTIKSSFVEDTEAKVIKTPIVEYVEGCCVCNNCGMDVTGIVKDHIITDREYQIMMTEEPIYYDGKTLASGWCGYHYFTGGGATIPIRAYYWENAPHFYKGGNQRDFNPVFTTGRIEQLASTGWKEDGTFGPYEKPNPHPELTCTRDWCFGPKGVLFTESQMLEMLSSEESRFYGVNDAEALLEDDMSFYHGYVQGCSAGYHMESRTRITGINELHVPATGHYEFTVN